MPIHSYENTSRTAKAGPLSLHYHEAGPADGPALVLLHGGGPGASGWGNFAANLPHFAQHFRTLIVDQPGYGRSDLPEPDRDYFSYSARAVVALMDELAVPRAQFLGTSLGGGVAARIAVDHPERAAKLLLNAPAGISFNLFSPAPSEGLRKLIEFGGSPEPTREQMRTFLTTLVHDPSRVTEALVEERYARATEERARLGSARTAASFAKWPEGAQLWREAHRISCPVLLTWGREDRVAPLDGAFVALGAIPDARLHVFPRCGHLVQSEAAEDFQRLATGFFLH
ncbi:alpha/beta fold hydrolase [Streptomyces sp. NPDC054838]